MPQPAGGSDQQRRSSRSKKLAQRVAVVDDTDRQQATRKRLDRLEDDDDAGEAFAEGSDEEYVAPQEGEEELRFGHHPALKVGKRRKGPTKRKTRGMLAEKQRGVKSFALLLEEADLESLPEGTPSYITAAVGPPVTMAPRKFCSVCGNISPYKCTRCGARFCSRKCNGVHTETRCLKFIA